MSYLIYCIYRSMSELIALLPIGMVFAMGRGFGLIAHALAWHYRGLVLRNLVIAYAGEKSPGELKALAREHFATLGANLFSSFKLATMSAERISGLVEIINMEALHRAAEPGRGVVLVLSHLGNWELLAQLVPHGPRGRAVGTVYQPLGNAHFDQHIKNTRARFGLVPFDRRRGFSEPIRFLREGNVCGVLVDQHAGDGGMWAPFFGRLASTSPLAATMALRTGAALVPVAIYTTGHARWRLAVSDPLPVTTADPDVLTAEINLDLERLIRRSPADWFWLHDRWKTPAPDFLLAKYKRGVTLPPGFDPERLKPFRILIRSTNWLGDAVMSAPAVRAIKAGRPDARITVAGPRKLAGFWRTMPEVADVVELEAREPLVSAAWKIRAGGPFDVAFVFPNSPRSACETWLAGVPRRIGYKRPWRGRLINARLLDREPGPMLHQAQHYLSMARYAGARITPGLLAPPRHPAPPGPPRLGLVPGAEYGPAKRWPAESFAEVAKAVYEKTGATWRIFGIESDRAAAEIIAGALDEAACENLAGRTTLAGLAESMRGCRLVLTNDTGAMHLAAHLGIPVVAIFGSTEHRLTGPLGPGARVIRHYVGCSPCFLRECPIDFRCMKSITPAEVTRAVLDEMETLVC